MSSRGSFTSRFGFILAAAGSAVGLGNIWKFPFEVANGGGAAFVILYLTFCFLLCFPVLVTEIAIGRNTEKNPIGAFNSLGFPRWNFIGKLGVFAGVIILSFYNIVAGWAFGYLFEMILGNFEIGKNFGTYTKDLVKVGSYAVIFMFMTSYIVSRGVSGGIEKLSRILMPSLLVMILGLMAYAFTLPNASAGLKYYLIPDFSKIDLKVMGGALRQAFFSLSLGMGTLITYGSYLSKKENIVSSAAYITLTDVGIAFIAGMMMFPFVAYNLGGDMTNVSGGPGLIFVTLPGVFETLGGWGVIVGAMFFLLLSFAALTSTVSLLEVPVAYAVDDLKIRRPRAVLIISTLIFIIGIPSLLSGGYSQFFTSWFKVPGAPDGNFMTLVVGLADTLLLLGGFLIVVFGAYVWKKGNVAAEVEQGYPGFKSGLVRGFFDLAIGYICPILLLFLFISVVLGNFFGITLF
jgi:neurotransmitter:Na+ symporter, NSS family